VGLAIDNPESRALERARDRLLGRLEHLGRLTGARKSLAPDVHVVATSTQPIMERTDLIGVDEYMTGLVKFADAVVPGVPVSSRASATTGTPSSC
jgi:hypothetical protein